jgi:hypothetical protein
MNQSDAPTPNYVTCPCQHCSGKIEFDASHAEEVVACPHCGLETKLHVSPVSIKSNTPPQPGNPVPQQVNVEIKRGVNPLGLASLILGIISCVFCWIPVFRVFVLPLALTGLALAILGLMMSRVSKKTDSTFPVSGGIVCLLSIFIAFPMTAEFEVLTNKAKSAFHKLDAHEREWIFQQGDIEVKIDNVVHGYTTGESKKERGLIVKTSNFLLINVTVDNLSSNKICDYTTLRNNATLTDNHKNNYRRIDSNKRVEENGKVYDVWEPPRYAYTNMPYVSYYGNSSRMYPLGGRLDELGFDIPDSPGDVLHLELSAENFGGTGKIKFDIPASRIQNW